MASSTYPFCIYYFHRTPNPLLKGFRAVRGLKVSSRLPPVLAFLGFVLAHCVQQLPQLTECLQLVFSHSRSRAVPVTEEDIIEIRILPGPQPPTIRLPGCWWHRFSVWGATATPCAPTKTRRGGNGPLRIKSDSFHRSRP